MLVDRLEELLTMLEDEDEREEKEEENREGAPALTGRVAPAAVPLEEDHGETAPAGDARRGAPAESSTGAPEPMAGEPAEVDGSGPEEKWTDGPVWRLDAGAAERAEAAWRRASAERPDRAKEIAAQAAHLAAEEAAETAEARLSAEKGGELARAVRHEAHSGLEELYRQTVQAVRPAAQAPAPGGEPSGRALRAGEPGRTAALTVDELDRAVRRDSRRYDGGMTIF